MEKGIIVISTESASMTNIHYDVEAFTDAGLGAFLMDSLAKQMGEEGEYVTMVGSMTMESHNNWADAAEARAAEKYPNMTLVADKRVSSESDSEKAYQLTKELLQKYPNLKGILGTSSFDAPGAARAIKELGLTGKVFAISVAMPSETRNFLKEGVLQAVGLWDPALSAKAMLNLAVKMFNGEEIKTGADLGVEGYKNVTIDANRKTLIIGQGSLAITKDNVDNFTF
jgi:simple sugar transport system substrate-binding protein